MVGLTSYQLGQITAAIVIPLLLLWWMIRWRRRGHRQWWIPMTLGILVVLSSAAQLLGDPEPSEPRPAVSLRAIDPLSVFQAQGYAFEPLDPEGQAAVDALKENDLFGVLRQVIGRAVVTDAGIGVGSIIVYEFEPRTVANPGAVDGFYRGVERDAGTLVKETIAGRETRRFSQQDPEVGTLESIIWQEENLFVMITALSEDEATRLARAIITRSDAATPTTPAG